MPWKSRVKLPTSLSHLAPLQKQLARLPPEDLNEDLDTTPLQKLLLRRTKGLSARRAAALLRKDCDNLRRWLALPGNATNPLHFFYGFLLIAADGVEELRDTSSSPSQKELNLGELSVDAPPGCRVKRLDSTLRLQLGQTVLTLGPTNKEGFDELMKTHNFAATIHHPASKLLISEVQFGPVKGTKFAHLAKGLPLKQITYLLQIPDGYCLAFLTGPGAAWSEIIFESYFSTIRLTRRTQREPERRA